MKMHRFTGLTSRDVLRKVRDQLGDGALILSNRAIPGGIEIIAASDSHVDALVDTQSSAPKTAQRRPMAPAPIPEPAPIAAATAAVAAAHAPAEEAAQAEAPAPNALARLRNRFIASRRAPAQEDAPAAPAAPVAKPAGRTLQTRVDDDVAFGEEDALAASTRMLAGLSLDRANAEVAQSAAQALASTAQFIARRSTVEDDQPEMESTARFAARREQAREQDDRPVTLRSFTERVEAQARTLRAEQQKTEAPMKARIEAQAEAGTSSDIFVRVEDTMVKPEAPRDDVSLQRSAFQADVKESIRAETDVMTRRMVGEIETLKSTLNDAMSSLASLGVKLGDPVRTRLFQTMLNAGFSAQLTRYVLENMPQHDAYEGALDFVQRAIEKNLSTVSDENSLLDQGGVFALMGPTGVGKTTTTAKLAARFVLRHGASRVALLSTDSYRIGGHEQLRIYGKILGVSVHAVKDAQDLSLALNDLREKHVVLIDTIGMSQRDRAVSEQMAMLHAVGPSIKRLLLLNAASNGKTLDEVVGAYRDANLAGCILTKIDEAASVGHAMDVMIRRRLPLHYVSYGQRVPEDIAVPNKKLLIHRSFRAGAEQSSFSLDSDESLLVAQGAVLRNAGNREPGLAAFDFA
ncbi:flagellar biosynthesis protein FlhF [Ralstonia sp. GP73]|jgi:flagellar biosynthesis protein FlhF|uniref:Flagellar biosynthesis protein FlhF n=3 Tax=Ralstonia TaxID=48736 RepID=A0AAD2BL03_9RALS|nr:MULTISPECIES: flagellar biosynthesis protein FlhF [Ralstonia]MBT2176397.1 flagellar biosynthesis protein FlhF [Ralstonia pickettii]MDH6640447.1 flagellar biosynthesis protein FlhF [Ralstonia sp. GP73]OCS46103.1 flagellar biosynthesis protein FlhF [Ralstonia pickettii]CAJ0711708.1 Signal recognition particle receptor FtsY [Ralstonia sp. LMG 18095]CAJ0780578.1 Signal recognition particle receptor FtsY [Ralstonia sp. LMG 18095]